MAIDRNQILNDAETAMRLVLDGRQSKIWTAMPCIVTVVNLASMTIEAQPAIQGIVEDENGKTQSVNLPVLVDVPIVFPTAGGFTITLPIAVGDEVLVIFAARCIDAWWQSGGVQRPMEARMNDLSDGFAIPGPRSQPNAISGISSTGLQIRNNAGTTYIEIASNGKIKMVSPTSVEITGDLKVTGEVTAKSATTPINLSTHTHSGVTPGGGNSGPPLP